MSESTVGVVGLGYMGRGICACLLGHGKRVVAIDRDRQAVEKARGLIDSALRELVERLKFDPAVADARKERFVEAKSLDDFRDCTFVIETVTENLPLKHSVFKALEDVVGPDVTLASNTSALPITSIQNPCRRPQRVIGMHWMEPGHVTRFCEVIRGEQTNDAAYEQTFKLAKELGKDPALVKRDVAGFIANRIGYAMIREALYLVEQGIADPEMIDRAFVTTMGNWSTVAGPFRAMDVTGLESYANVMPDLLPTLSNATGTPKPLRDLIASGAKGMRNGRGFYKYEPGDEQHWMQLFRDHVWRVRAMQDEYAKRMESKR